MSDKRPDETWEGYAERLIREAQDEGEFDRLPGFGQPCPLIDGPDEEDWWLKDKLRRERASVLPPALQIRVDVHHALERLWTLATEAAVRGEVSAINDRIHRATFAITWGPASTTLPLEVDEILARWRAHREAGGRL